MPFGKGISGKALDLSPDLGAQLVGMSFLFAILEELFLNLEKFLSRSELPGHAPPQHVGFAQRQSADAGVRYGTGGRHQPVRHGLVVQVAEQAAPGDANGDRRFDQLDIVRLLQGNKYLTGQSADWMQGDFTGDGLFDQARGRVVGSDLYLTKPFTKEELLAAVAQHAA